MTPGNKVIVYTRRGNQCEEREGVLVEIEHGQALVDFDSGREWAYKSNCVEVPTETQIAVMAGEIKAKHYAAMRGR